MSKANRNNRDQRLGANRDRARSFMVQYTDKLHKNTARTLGSFDPNDPHLRLGSQSLALTYISEGVELLLGMGMDEGDIQSLAGRAAQRAKTRQALARQEIEVDEADAAEDDFIGQLAASHTDHEEQPGGGVDPDAKPYAPAPSPIDQSQPAAVQSQPSAVTGQQQSPPNSPQDKLAQESLANGGQTTTVKDAQTTGDQAAQTADTGTSVPNPDQSSDQTNFNTDAADKEKQQASIQDQQGEANAKQTGTTEKLGMADQIDGEVVKADTTQDKKAKAAADARASAANAAQ